VFADESHFNLLELGRSYSLIRGERASRYKVSIRGKIYFILPALSLDGLLHLKVVEIEITRDIFREFVQGLLPRMNEWPLSNSVLIIDNALIHNVAGLRKMVEGRGARLLYLPDYSPDYNPIESSFPELEEWLRTNGERVDQALDSAEGTVYDLFWEAIHSITMKNAKAWYRSCGYEYPKAFKLHGAPLYGCTSMSTCTLRVALIAKERNLHYELILVNVRHPLHLQHQPFGQIPYITVRLFSFPYLMRWCSLMQIFFFFVI
jgi:transposase